MRVLVQRVKEASVTIGGAEHSRIGKGMLVFVGVTGTDLEADAEYLAHRCSHLRIFEDAEGKMNLSVQDTGSEMLVVSQFTLYGDTRKGNRPSFIEAAPPDLAERLYELFLKYAKGDLGESRVRSGVFRAMMDVGLVNDGPVTLMIESKNR